MNEPKRKNLINETLQAFLDLVLTQKFADMPNWMDLDLSVSQLRAIYLLSYYGSLTVSELARSLDLGNPAASVLIQQLVQQKLVERSEDPHDRRRTLVSLTERGVELVSGRRDRREAKARQWLNQLGDDELAGLLSGLTALIEIIRTDQTKGVGQPSKYTQR